MSEEDARSSMWPSLLIGAKVSASSSFLSVSEAQSLKEGGAIATVAR